MKRNEKTERNRRIYAKRKAGKYYRQIAEEENLSIIRIRQIIEVQEAKEAAGHEQMRKL